MAMQSRFGAEERVTRDLDADGDAAANLMERRWFACITAVTALKAECEVLREVMEMAEDSWRRARTELVRLEALRDALDDEMSQVDAGHRVPTLDRAADERKRVISAA
jgi:hypothetical protein